jgi:peptide deformylase
MNYEFVRPNDPILREVIPEWDFAAPALGRWNPKIVATGLWLTMRKGNGIDRGIGIAAPQVGIRLRMTVLHMHPEKQPFSMATVCLNPRVLKTMAEPTPFTERCLTWPGRDVVVHRPDAILAHWTDLRGRVQERELYGVLARAFQHELDHLNGVTIL